MKINVFVLRRTDIWVCLLFLYMGINFLFLNRNVDLR
jgi:hypothetical protein